MKNRSCRKTVSLKVSRLLILWVILLNTACVDKQESDSKKNLKPKINVNDSESMPTKTVADYWPELKPALPLDETIENNISTMISTMTLAQKVAQMIQPEIGDFTVEDMRRYGFGSYLNGGGSFPNRNKHATPQDWITLAENMYQASVDDSLDGSSIPTMWGTDAVHGHNNVIGATLFPHNIGLGAANNPQLIEKIASATAQEVMVTGIDWVFAPTVAVVRDDRWGRTYEGYAEDPEIVRSYAESIVKGLQGSTNDDFLGQQRVIATVKHFIGDGGTEKGDDQGDNLADEETLFKIHAQGYVGGLNVGAQTVMASFNSWHGVKNHGNHYLLTDILKTRMGFDGFVVGDWNGHGQVKGCSNQSCAQAVNAGLDMFMVPGKDWKPLLENTIAQVENGEIALSRINDAVARILRVKMRAGLFTKPSPANRPLSGKTDIIGSTEHRNLARQAVRESLVLLKNKNHILPLAPNKHYLIAGDAANNIGKQSGGWSITWQGTGNSNADFPGGTSIYDGLKNKILAAGGSIELNATGDFQQKPDAAIVVFGEEPYAEGNGDIDNLEYQRGNKRDLALLRKLKTLGIPVISIFISGRPLWLNPEINASNAFVAAWLPGSEGAGIADVLIAKKDGDIGYDFTGKLSFSWPNSATQTPLNIGDADYHPLFPFGYGLSYTDDDRLADNLSEVSAAAANELPNIDLLSSPWRHLLRSSAGETLIASNHASDANITYQTIDRNIQEDARLVVFNGNGLASVEINDNFPYDLRGYYEANSSLSFAVQVESAISAPVFLGMRCEVECDANIDITSMLSKIEAGRWRTISIDLACFANKGATMDKIIAPFVLTTDKPLEVKYSEVKIIPNNTRHASIVCAKKVE